MNYQMSLEQRKLILKSNTNTFDFECNSSSDHQNKNLFTDSMSAIQVLDSVLTKNYEHVFQNSLQPAEEKIDFIERLKVNKEVFFMTDFCVLNHGRVYDFKFNELTNRDFLIESIFQNCGLDPTSNRMQAINQILYELVMNVQIDAISQSSNNNNKESHIKVELAEKYMVLSIIDFFGSLDCFHLLKVIRNAYNNGIGESINFNGKGAGIGSSIIFNHCDSLIVGSRKNKVTRVSAVLPFNMSEKKLEHLQKSLHII